MAKTRGQVGSRRSKRNQGLEVVDQEDKAPQLKVKKRTAKKTASPKKNLVLTPTRRSSRIKKVAAEDDYIEDVTLPKDDEVQDVTPTQDDEVEDGQAEKSMSEEDKDDEEDVNGKEDEEDGDVNGKENEENGDLNGKENEEEPANMEDDGVLNEKGNEEEACEEEARDMEEDGTAQDDEIPITLSSFLGPLVREHVPVTLADWRKLDAATKATMWEEIQGRFNLQEEWQKAVIFKQLGNVWRAGKSRLVSQVRVAKTAAERIALKPSNIPSLQLWNTWVKSKTTKSFTETSNKYRAMRRNQIPHTTSRKGMLRLADDMVKE
ncbi:nucleolin-like [Brassica napus]|uniref:nucleolin-like n=1 Tax=Brassica napus TaxID=3708 RepID=UPI002078F15D|nr:nucleolin-like [Brassica napus]